MTWQLITALAFTIPALLVTVFTIPYFLYRRYKRLQKYRQGPEHIESRFCRCYYCQLNQ